MNHKDTAIAAVVIALVLTAVVFTIPTREALAWGFFGSKTKVDQSINQLNNCTNSRPDDTYRQSSYDPGTDNKPSTANSDNTKNQAVAGNTKNQASTDNSDNTKNHVTSEDDTGNKQPNKSASDYQNNNKSLVLCTNKATNLAQIG
jgi:hypothetical protein